MQTVRGFSLVEILVYIALSVLLISLVLSFAAYFVASVRFCSAEAVYTAAINAGVDAIVRDCSSAPCDPIMWSNMKPDFLLWRCSLGYVGFAFRHGGLMRISRSIDATGQLLAPVYVPLLKNVRGSFAIDMMQGRVVAVNLLLEWFLGKKYYSIQKKVYLHEGIVA